MKIIDLEIYRVLLLKFIEKEIDSNFDEVVRSFENVPNQCCYVIFNGLHGENQAESIKWMKDIIRNGHREACTNLGYMIGDSEMQNIEDFKFALFESRNKYEEALDNNTDKEIFAKTMKRYLGEVVKFGRLIENRDYLKFIYEVDDICDVYTNIFIKRNGLRFSHSINSSQVLINSSHECLNMLSMYGFFYTDVDIYNRDHLDIAVNTIEKSLLLFSKFLRENSGEILTPG